MLLLFFIAALTIAPNGPLQAEALYPYRILKNSSHLMTLTPEEWTSEYECDANLIGTNNSEAAGQQQQGGIIASTLSRAGNLRRSSSVPNVCYREPTAWRFLFFDELLQPPFRLLVQESSIDERLSDVVYMTTSMTGLNLNHYRFKSDEGREVDLRNERLVAGAQVNDQLCRDQLRQMLGQIEEMRAKLDTARRQSKAPDSSLFGPVAGGGAMQVASLATSSAPKLGINLDHRHFRLARVLDSYGRYESGHLGGRHHSMGVYEQCIGTQLALRRGWSADQGNASARLDESEARQPGASDEQQELANSRYCWASLSVDRYLSEPLAKRPRYSTEADDFGIHVGVCVPEACHSKSFNPNQPGNRELARDTRHLLQQIINTQFKMPDTIYLQQSLELDRVFCLVDPDSKWAQMPLSGKILLAGLACWACLLVLATYKRRHKHSLDGCARDDDCGEPEVRPIKGAGAAPVLSSSKARHSGRSLLANLDLFESWCEFIGARDTPRSGPINLDTLNPLKCMASLLVVLVHAGLIVGPLTGTPIQLIANMERSRIEMLMLSGFILIDTFFVISALLLTYISLKKLLRQKIKRNAWHRQQQLELRLKDLMLDGAHQCETTIGGGGAERYEDRKETTTKETKGMKNGRAQVAASLAIDVHELEAPAVAQPLPLASGPDPKSQSSRVHLFGFDFFRTWAFITLYRYFRLVPMYFLVFWFKKSVFNYLGSGPFWDHGLNIQTPAGGCRHETWFTPVSFMSAYLEANKQCLPQAWSISNDLFFNLAAPPLIILYFKRPRLAKWLAAMLVVVGLITGFIAYYIVDPRYRYELEQVRFHGAIMMFNLSSHMYTNPIYRIPAVVLGIMGGYALYRYEQWGTHELLAGSGATDHLSPAFRAGRRRHSPLHHEWPVWFKRVATPMALATLCLASVTSFMAIEMRQWLGYERRGLLVPAILVAYHAIWSLSNVIVLLRMVTDWKDSFLMRMASGKFWSVGSKLTYGLLLIHWDLLTYEQNTRLYAAIFSRSVYFGAFSMAYLIALLLSTILYVCIENPLDKLTKTYLLRA